MARPRPRILASRCPQCGAPKTRASATAYVYCDHCGALADYDFRKACEAGSALPGPAYRALQERLNTGLAEALAAGDRARHLALQVELYDAWVEACPKAVPPRVGDPDYRRAYVAHLAAGGSFAAFDPETQRISAAMTAAVAKLKWSHGKGGPRVDGAGFADLMETVVAQVDHALSDGVLARLPPHPDEAPAPLHRRMSLAMFVQGWLPYLDKAAAQALLERTGLAGEYIDLDAPGLEHAHCGHCKSDLPVMAGARECICEGCGRRVAVGRRLDCDGCGARLAVDARLRAFDCPYCQRKLESLAPPDWLAHVPSPA